MNTMHIMGRKGDKQVTWEPQVDVEVEKARCIFEELLAGNYTAFSVGEEETLMVETFDPTIPKLVMVPVVAGG